MRNRFLSALLVAVSCCVYTAPVSAGTTGSIRGRVTDSASGAPIAGAALKATSASQTATTTTDAQGAFAFISLEPDTYTVTAQRAGYDGTTEAGISVFADQTQTVSLGMSRTLKTIASTHSRSSSSIIKPGTTSDVYSVNPSEQKAASAVAGSGGLNTAYSAIATVPGVNMPQGQQGWNQLIYVRGGDFTDVSTELDGVPISRASDYGAATGLSSLGQQEVQVYTGGTPASDTSALAGFVNQVIKTGRYPGYAEAELGIGSPQFYHNGSFEAGEATADRLFSIYVATQAVDQSYRYANQHNGAGLPLTTWPLLVSTGYSGIYDGSNNGTPWAAPGQLAFSSDASAYGMAYTQSRESIANLHFGIPHHHDSGRDDVQALYITGDVFSSIYSSMNDLGLPGPLPYADSFAYNGPLFTTPNIANITPYYQPPYSATTPPSVRYLDPNTRDTDNNAFSISKLQYQRNFNERSFLRVFGYSQFTGWYINGPVSSTYLYGGEPQDFEVHSNVFGGTAMYTNELSGKHLITATVSVDSQKILYTNPNNYDTPITYNYVGSDGQCYDPGSGSYASCFAGSPGYATANATNPVPAPASAPAGSPAFQQNARWLVTESGQSGQFDTVHPIFSSASLTDQIRPNDKLLFNVGARFDHYLYKLDDTSSTMPARQFWFNAWNRENCYIPGTIAPTQIQINPATGASMLGGQPFNCVQSGGTPLTGTVPPTVSLSAFEPRFSMTYTLNPDTVIRASAGLYTQPIASQFYQFDTHQQDLPSFLSQFLPLGFTSPYQSKTPEYSDSYDLSLEKHIKGTQYSFKLTPYYRNTWQQSQTVPVGTLGFADAFNVGQQRNYGLELLFRSGDFARQGLSYQLSYTLSHSQVRYGTLSNGQSFLDTLNNYIQLYNSYTSACASQAPAANVTAAHGTMCGIYGNTYSQATFTNAIPGGGTAAVQNPYYNNAPQPLFDRNGWYTPYDTLPAPFIGAVGYATPSVGTLIVNYRTGKLAITPSFTYSSGANYGSPLVWPGYDPTLCAADPKVTGNAQQCYGFIFTPDHYSGRFDSQGAFKDPSRFTANLQLDYQVSPTVDTTLAITSLIDTCFQRGYAWDNATTCSYATLPSGHLAPVGNFYPLASAPIQLLYPYGAGGNGSYNGLLGQRLPISAVFNVHLKL